MNDTNLARLMVKVPFAERRDLVQKIDQLHKEGIRLDPILVAKVKAYAEPPPKSDEPTPEQIQRMLKHFGK